MEYIFQLNNKNEERSSDLRVDLFKDIESQRKYIKDNIDIFENNMSKLIDGMKSCISKEIYQESFDSLQERISKGLESIYKEINKSIDKEYEEISSRIGQFFFMSKAMNYFLEIFPSPLESTSKKIFFSSFSVYEDLSKNGMISSAVIYPL